MHGDPVGADSEKQLATEAEKEQWATYVCEYQNVFSANSQDLGHTRLVQHKINTGDSLPIKQPTRRVPLHKRDVAQEEINKMLSRGVIGPCDSSWSSLFVLVQKRVLSSCFVGFPGA